jgi:hypothetical protein
MKDAHVTCRDAPDAPFVLSDALVPAGMSPEALSSASWQRQRQPHQMQTS